MNLRMLVIDTIDYNGQDLKPGRLVRVHPGSVQAYHDRYGAAVKFWQNWPNKPEVFLDPVAPAAASASAGQGQLMTPAELGEFDLDQELVPELRNLARACGLDHAGIRADLLERLKAYAAS